MFRKNNAGFSLVEILIYISVIVVVTSAISGVFLSIAQGQGKSEIKAEMNSNIRFALAKINQDILSASAVSVPAAAGNTSDSLTLTIGASQVSYCTVNNRLRRSSGGACDGNSEPIISEAVKINSLSFTRLENSNSILGKTTVSIQTVLKASFNGVNPNYEQMVTKQITSSLR